MTSTMRPGCSRQPRIGALQPAEEGPRSNTTEHLGCPRQPRIACPPPLPCRWRRAHPRHRPVDQVGRGFYPPPENVHGPVARRDPPPSPGHGYVYTVVHLTTTVTKRTKLAPPSARHTLSHPAEMAKREGVGRRMCRYWINIHRSPSGPRIVPSALGVGVVHHKSLSIDGWKRGGHGPWWPG